jgi:hypothetical protein
MVIMFPWIFVCGMHRDSHLERLLAITEMVDAHICASWLHIHLDTRVPVQLVLSF